MPKEETGTLQAGGENVPLETSGPYREEVEPQINAETLTGDPARGGDAATHPNGESTLGKKDATSTQGPNPKRTENSRPD